jgi:hypothetical protein
MGVKREANSKALRDPWREFSVFGITSLECNYPGRRNFARLRGEVAPSPARERSSTLSSASSDSESEGFTPDSGSLQLSLAR